ncbi:MAG: hypothetical protein MSS65_07220 [Clostridium sp.]|nr:hypothetical protein [Clostridium sp.]
MAAGRKTRLSIIYNGKDISQNIKKYVESFRYTDVASGESDEIELELNNSSGMFIKGHMPRKGDKITSTIYRYNWDSSGSTIRFRCGKFYLDDLSYSGPPMACTIGGVSSPVKGAFKSTKRSKTYKNVTIRELARVIAKRSGMTLHYSAASVKIKEIEQSKTADSEFLLSICQEYGLGLKIFGGKIIIFDEEKYEQKAPKCTIKRCNCENWSWNTTLQGTYTGAKVTYTSPTDNKTHKVMIGKEGRVYHANVSASSTKEAVMKAKAQLAEQNKQRTTMQLTIMPGKTIVATDTIRLSGFYKLNGKYYVDKVEHAVTGESGYVQTLTLHKVTPRISNRVSVNSKGK